MKQKPILFLLVALMVSAGIVMYPEAGILHLKNLTTEEGNHPKNVYLSPLSVNCPSPMVLAANANCMAELIVSPPSSTCGNITSLSYTLPGGMPVTVTLPPPASINLGFFPAGLFTIVWNVADDCPPLPTTAVCNQLIKIDTQLPTISCPVDVTVGNNPNGRRTGQRMMLTPVDVAQPTVNDNCGILSVINTFNGTDDASGNYPLGTTQVCWTVTDLAANTASCCMNVTVIDDLPPVITCPDTIKVQCIAPLPYSTFVLFQAAGGSASDETLLNPSSFMFVKDSIAIMTFPNKKTIHRYYKIADNVGNMDTCFQVISINDTVLPGITCPANREADLNNNCSLPVPDLRSFVTISDNCVGTTIVQSPLQGTTIPSSHNQTHTFTFTVTDGAGLSTSCSITVTAKDKLGPDIVCRDPRVISLSNEPELQASSFITSATDNCGGTLTYTARRMGNICGGNTPDDLGNYVQFCCDDVNDTIRIVVRVTDQRGFFTECMTSVIVQDNLPPVVMTPLPDISVSCEYPLNLSNLSIFGTFVASGSPRQNIIINDAGHPFYPPAGLAGQDGVYSDNCPGVTVTVTSRNMLTTCNTGQIKRDFLLRDAGNNVTTYTQTIHVIDVDKFDINDIVWPSTNVDYNNCNDPDPDKSVTGEPTLTGDKCSMVAATYSDQTFSYPIHCSYIKRTWSVIDWCQYKSNIPMSPGKWTFVQNIYVKNAIAPTINANVCRDTIICAQNASCFANVTFNAAGTDDCLPVNITWTYKIDINNNGGAADISGTGATVSGQFDLGTHKLTWEAKDGCKNISICSFLFTIRDCKAPTAIAKNGLALNLTPPLGMATIWATDFNNFSNDNCTPAGQLKYSFSANVNDTGRVFTCNSIGPIEIELWVTDLAGNKSKAVTYVDVQDNQNICSNGNRIQIAGHIFNEDKINIPDTKVTIDGGETEGELMTDKEGKYKFGNLAMFNNYQLIPVKNVHHTEGISTLDLVMIQRHILGIKHLTSPYKVIAADVNNSQSITASDLVELRKLILGIQSEFSKNTSWRFVDAAYSFDEPMFPWPFMESLSYEGLESNMNTSDFIAVKIGDVNNSSSDNYTGATSGRSKTTSEIFMEDEWINAGQLVSVPVKSDDLTNDLGIQWTFELSDDVSYEGFEAVGIPIKSDHIAEVVKDGRRYLTLSYDDIKGISVPKDVSMFNLILKSKKPAMLSQLIRLNSDITKSVAIGTDEEEKDLTLVFRTNNDDVSSYILQNVPNPFRDETQIEIFVKDFSTVNISLYDAKGSTVFKSAEVLPAGKHILTINEKQMGNKLGVFYCKIKSKDLNEVIKILRIE